MPVVTHMKAQGLEQGNAGEAAGDDAGRDDARALHRRRRLSRTSPARPSLGALLIPAWAQDGGREEMLEALQGSGAARAHRRGDRSRR